MPAVSDPHLTPLSKLIVQVVRDGELFAVNAFATDMLAVTNGLLSVRGVTCAVCVRSVSGKKYV